MFTKKGGGNLPQPYNIKNGQYINKTISELNELDEQGLTSYSLGSQKLGSEFPHFPTYIISSEKYSWSFVLLYKSKFKPYTDGSDNKIKLYLLSPASHGRDIFLTKYCNYLKNEWSQIQKDIFNGTNFDSIIYSRINFNKENPAGTLSVMALTELQNKKICTTIWNVQIDQANNTHYKIVLQNLYPGDKIYYEQIKKFKSWR